MKSSSSAAAGGWLVKSEPETYSWADLVRERKTAWTGVRNYAARNHLNAMQRGDRVFFYESGGPKAIVGIAEVTRTAFPDETADEPGWVAVELKAVEPLKRPVTLDEIKADPALANMALVRIGRLSVQPVTASEFARILKMAK
jgi:predicted RNA-binding protein with PUA-like domain